MMHRKLSPVSWSYLAQSSGDASHECLVVRVFAAEQFSILICLGFAVSYRRHGPARPRLGLAPAPYVDRWVYCSFNLQVDKSVDDLIALIERASRDGYTGIVLADYKFQVLYRVPDFYFRNVERVKAAAARAKIELIPAVFSIGYSNGILAQDPNLAEGLPVVDQPYLVKNRVAVLEFPADGPDQERQPRGHERRQVHRLQLAR